MAKSLISVDYSQFFDRKTVIDAVELAERKQLSKAGAFVRRRARSSIRLAGKRGSSSKPGKPPKTPRGTPQRYKDTIFFGYDKRRGSVVIGPSSRFGDGKVPSILEFGGSMNVKNRRMRDTPALRRRASSFKTEGAGAGFIFYTGRLTYEARPHMNPALIAEAPNFPGLFRNSVK